MDTSLCTKPNAPQISSLSQDIERAADRMPRRRVTFLLVPVYLVFSVSAQSIFINEVPAYSSLDQCAEAPLSTIVRDMYSGCSDNSHTTSFNCVWSSSSSTMNEIITSAILSRCPNAVGDASSALDVFASY